MKLSYVGPKEIISHHGISFKDGKEDKYSYIASAMQIYHAIHHDYKKDVIYSHDIKKELSKDEDILNKILNLKPELKETCEHEINQLTITLDEEIKNIEKLNKLNKEEQKVYQNNLIIMKEYTLQRQTNKVIYNHILEIIVDDILENKLKEINTPFNEKYWHVLQSIQGELSNHEKRSIGSCLDTIHKDSITISLKINSIGR
jgi:hypothetical protein